MCVCVLLSIVAAAWSVLCVYVFASVGTYAIALDSATSIILVASQYYQEISRVSFIK